MNIPINNETIHNDISFYCNEEILKLTPKGMFYKDKFIDDAGEAHKIFIQFMNMGVNTNNTDNSNNSTSFIEFGGSKRSLDLS